MPSQKPLFRPALGGPDPKTDPELARQMRALQRQMQATPPDDAQGQTRQNMQQHQLMQADELDQADQALGSDERVLAELISQLKQAQQGELQPGEASQLSELLQSADVQQALSMAARQQPPATDAQTPDGKPGEAPKDAQAGAAETPSPARLPPASQLKLESTSLGTVTGDAILVELKDLDLATRAIIMKMQPKVREELIQGLREEGPEGYRQFIRDYFRRLTKARSGGQQ